ncbi:MAG: ATP synthase F1 subunit delta [Deltaproteobacteria bacterium]|nr:ATP synthase F1 subunit delta [Deltaproteobacteria bacterium]
MLRNSVAKKYARALLDIALEDKMAKEIGGELSTLSAIISDNSDLSTALLQPMYGMGDRQGLAEAVCEKAGLSQTVQRFLAVLVETRDVLLLPEMAGAYARMLDDIEGRLHVIVETPWELDSSTEAGIKEKLHSLTGKEIILASSVNRELIGGIVIKMGNTILDSSVKAQLERVEEKIVEGVV